MNNRLTFRTILAAAILAAVTASPVFAVTLDYALIADTNTPIPGGTDTFKLLPLPGISNGNVIFRGENEAMDQFGIYFFRDGELDVLVNQNTPIPDGTGSFTSFRAPTLDPHFNVAFLGEGSSGQIGIYTQINGFLSRLADSTTKVPGTLSAETFTKFSSPWIYDGEVVFRGLGSGGREGIYTNKGGALRVVADTTTNIPDGMGAFSGFGFNPIVPGSVLLAAPSIDGDIAFRGDGSDGQEGIYAEIGGTLIKVADKNTLIPGTSDPFPSFDGNVSLAANIYDDEIVFVGGDSSSGPANTSNLGLYKYSQGTLSTIVDRDTVVPETGGTLTLFGGAQGYAFNDGNVSFLGKNTLSGFNQVYAVLDGQLTTVATDRTVIEGNFVGGLGSYGQGLEDGSVAFNTASANFVAIQEYRWVSTSGGDWDAKGSWLFGRTPRDFVPTVIQPSIGGTVSGPNGTATLHQLTLGAGAGVATLDIPAGGTIIVNDTANIQASGRLAGDGTFVAKEANFTVDGTVDLGIASLQVIAENDLTNNGSIQGGGDVFVGKDLTNNGSMDIDGTLNISEGLYNNGTLVIDGVASAGGTVNGLAGINDGVIRVNGQLSVNTVSGLEFTNNGTMRVDGQLTGSARIDNTGTVEVRSGASITNPFTNNAGALVTGDGTLAGLQANGGTIRVVAGDHLALTNAIGHINASGTTIPAEIDLLGGTLEVSSTLFNGFGGIGGAPGIITGRGTLIAADITNDDTMAFSGDTDILGDVTNNDTIIISGKSTLTFFDDVIHNGTEIRTGLGPVFMEGDVNPGNSAAIVTFAGDLHMGTGATTHIELGGLAAGDFDQLDVAGDLSLAGVLEVVLLGSFNPQLGDSFTILQGGTVNSDFNSFNLAALDLGLHWSIDNNASSYTLNVVPEPSSRLMAALGLLGMLTVTLRQRRM